MHGPFDDKPSGDDAPAPEPANLRFLRRLVTVLTAVMIAGMLTVVTLLALRINQPVQAPPLPDRIVLPEGARALAVTHGPGWFAVVTQAGRILIYTPDGRLLQSVDVVAE